MESSERGRDCAAAQKRWFPSTHWSVVLAAGQTLSPDAQAALERLCRTYWYPLYAHLRQLGHAVHDAQDLTQTFLAQLLAKGRLEQVDRRKGKFRTFLLTALNNFLADERKRARAEKRGGGQPLFSLDEQGAEARFLQEPVAELGPPEQFDRRWALTVLDHALISLQTEFAVAGKSRVFDSLKTFLSTPGKAEAYAAAGARLGANAGTVAVMVHRLRLRYRELVREEIAHTVANPNGLAEEMHYLFSLIVGPACV
jgi:RNA polymerase sigma-70 factor (ECF subfamily)